MSRHLTLSGFLRKSRFPLIVFGLMYYFANSFMTGENGYFAKQKTMAELEEKRIELETLRATRVALDKKVSLMTPGNLDRDLLDEEARHVLGLADKDELVIILDEEDEVTDFRGRDHPEE